MATLSTLFLYSSCKYSTLADSVFGDSVQQSQFASSISAMRMQTAKAIMGTPRDIVIELDDEVMEALSGGPDWQYCLAFDNLIMRVMSHNEQAFLPLLNGVYTAAHKGVAYASQVDDRPEHKLCLSCGSISEQWECPICGNGRNWLKGVEVPENTEEVEPENTMPNFTFGDFPPERPIKPKKWEVLCNGREDDIFKATALARPTLG